MKTVGTGMTRRDGRGGRRRLGGCGAGRPGEAGDDDWADVEPEGRERREAPIGRMCSGENGGCGRHRLGGCAAGRTEGAEDTDWADVEPEGREGDFRYGGNVQRRRSGTLRAVNLEGWRRLERGLESEQLAESDSKAWAVPNFAYREHDTGHEALAVHGVVSYR